MGKQKKYQYYMYLVEKKKALSYLPQVLGQTGLSEKRRPRSDAAEYDV